MKSSVKAWMRESPGDMALRLCRVGVILLGGYIAFRLTSFVKVWLSIFNPLTRIEGTPSADLLKAMLLVLGLGTLLLTIRVFDKRKRRKITIQHAR